MTEKQLINLSKQRDFMIGNFRVVSQEPNAIPESQRSHSVVNYLPQLIAIWKDIEKVTGYRWKCTSYIRNSPSHSKGHAIDLAPHIEAKDVKHYAVYNQSDPVLYKRAPLVKALQRLKNIDYSGKRSNHLGIFLEPDHLHIQILAPTQGDNRVSVVKWGIPKPIYKDTYQRMDLPPTIKGYLK